MPLTPPVNVPMVATSFWAMAKEITAPATAGTNFVCIPTGTFEPSNKPTWIDDTAMRGAPVKVYNEQMGPLWAEHTVPESPVFGDTFGHVLLNMFGDLVSTGTSSGTPWTTTAALTPGESACPVSTGAVAAAGTFAQIDSALNSEVIKVGTGSTTTSVVPSASTPIRFNHLSGVTIQPVIAPFSHTFTALNVNSSTGLTGCQPPTHTIAHRTTLAGSGGNLADQYLYSCVSEITITGKKSGMVSWSGKITSWSMTHPAAPITAAFSSVQLWPSWQSTNTIATVATPNVVEWSATFTREMDVVSAADGQQSPYCLSRGPLESTFKLTYDAVVDQGPLTTMLNNTQPALVWAVTNGLSGASQVAMNINAGLAAFKSSDLKPQKTMWGWEVSGSLLPSTALAGNSGGYTPAQIALTNAVATF